MCGLQFPGVPEGPRHCMHIVHAWCGLAGVASHPLCLELEAVQAPFPRRSAPGCALPVVWTAGSSLRWYCLESAGLD